MENLDATIIATAAPAMAADLGVGAVDINVAITAYLVTIAVGIPVSGWLTDRFGGRRILLVGHRDLHGRLRPLRRQRQPGDARRRPDPAGDRRRDDGAGRPARRAAGDGEAGSARRDGLPDLAGAARSGARAGLGWLDRVGRHLAVDLPDQPPARRRGVRGRRPDRARREAAVGRPAGLGRVSALCRVPVVPAGRGRARWALRRVSARPASSSSPRPVWPWRCSAGGGSGGPPTPCCASERSASRPSGRGTSAGRCTGW